MGLKTRLTRIMANQVNMEKNEGLDECLYEL